MKIYSEVGKLSNEELDRLILSKIKTNRREVIESSSIGGDTAVLDVESDYVVLSSDPITGAAENLGALAIHISVNDVSTVSADAVGVLLTLLLPVNTRSDEIERIMADAQAAAEDVQMDIIGGHTEITDAVNKPVMISTVIGRVEKEKRPDPSRIKPGDVVAMSKYAGLEGTAILLSDYTDKFKGLSESLIASGKELMYDLSVQREGTIAANYAVGYMHDVTEGGIEGAIWESAQAIGKGMIIDKDAIPVHEATKAIARLLDIDIYRLISSGSMLVVMDAKDFEAMERELTEANILFTKIGIVTETEDILIKKRGETSTIAPPGPDELFSAIGQLQ